MFIEISLKTECAKKLYKKYSLKKTENPEKWKKDDFTPVFQVSPGDNQVDVSHVKCLSGSVPSKHGKALRVSLARILKVRGEWTGNNSVGRSVYTFSQHPPLSRQRVVGVCRTDFTSPSDDRIFYLNLLCRRMHFSSSNTTVSPEKKR